MSGRGHRDAPAEGRYLCGLERGTTMALFGKKSETTAPILSEGVARTTPPRAQPSSSSVYGIEQAIQLMRTLPGGDQNIDLIVRVVKNTLASVNVQLATIIDDASVRQKGIQERTAVLKGEIQSLEQEIAKREQEIGRLEDDLAETTKVKDNLELAEASSDATFSSAGPPAASHRPPNPASPRSPRSKPPPPVDAPVDSNHRERVSDWPQA